VAKFTSDNVDEARAYLNSLSDHPDRPGDTSKLHPAYAVAMANAIDTARAAGMPVRLLSGQREGNVTNSPYDRGGYSSHIYGLASDVEGIGAAGSDTASKWRTIAQQYGLSSPYNPLGSEWNHWQMGPKLENDPKLLASLQRARATGDTTAMWDAYNVAGVAPPSHQPANLLNRGTGSQAPIAAQPSGNMTHEQFIRDYAQKIGINPDVAVGVANAEGLRAWSPSNPNAGSYVDRTAGVPWSFGDFQLNTRNGMGVDALKAGIDPKDPNQWQKADMFALDQMKQGGLGPWKGDAFARSWGAKPITGTTLTSTPALAESGIGSGIPTPAQPNATAVAAETPPAPPQSFADRLFKKPPSTVDEKGNVVEGKSGVEKLADSISPPKAQQAPAAAPEMQAAPVVDPTAGLAPAAQQLFQSVQQASMKPLTWNSRPYGSMAGQQFDTPGMTLNTSGYGYG
jgi:hypothetical protein